MGLDQLLELTSNVAVKVADSRGCRFDFFGYFLKAFSFLAEYNAGLCTKH